MTNHLSLVTYGSPAPPEFQHVVISALSFDATVDRLKRALQEHDLWLIQEIDPQMLLQRGGYHIYPTRQLLFFHPRYMARLLALDPNALIEAPLKLVVMQTPDGKVTVRFMAFEMTFGRYDTLTELTKELATLCQRLVQTVTEPSMHIE
jgi:uncharacterized protein (DUF302 family)